MHRACLSTTMLSAAKRDETVFLVMNRQSNDTAYQELVRHVLKGMAAGVAYDQLRANRFRQELDVKHKRPCSILVLQLGHQFQMSPLSEPHGPTSVSS